MPVCVEMLVIALLFVVVMVVVAGGCEDEGFRSSLAWPLPFARAVDLKVFANQTLSRSQFCSQFRPYVPKAASTSTLWLINVNS